MLNSTIDQLPAFPFRRLASLLERAGAPGGPVIDLALGEPQRPPPALLADAVAANADLWNRYPPPAGAPDLLAASAAWLEARNDLEPGAVRPGDHLVAVAGTKEALFLAAQTALERSGRGAVLFPNPMYAVYAGAAAMAGVEPAPLTATRESGFLPDLDAQDEALWRRAGAFYLGNPTNPQGAIADEAYLVRAIERARAHDFVLFVDECYSELYDRTPPLGALGVARRRFGDFRNVVVFHSLSKRSNAAGLRAGFVAGDERFVAASKKLRAYAAPVIPLPLAAAAAALWRDERHVEDNRAFYRAQLDRAEKAFAGRFGFERPAAGFFLWLDVGEGERAAIELWRASGLKVLPGSYLSVPDATGADPGARYARVALVRDAATTEEALRRIVDVLGEPRLAAAP